MHYKVQKNIKLLHELTATLDVSRNEIRETMQHIRTRNNTYKFIDLLLNEDIEQAEFMILNQANI